MDRKQYVEDMTLPHLSAAVSAMLEATIGKGAAGMTRGAMQAALAEHLPRRPKRRRAQAPASKP